MQDLTDISLEELEAEAIAAMRRYVQKIAVEATVLSDKGGPPQQGLTNP